MGRRHPDHRPFAAQLQLLLAPRFELLLRLLPLVPERLAVLRPLVEREGVEREVVERDAVEPEDPERDEEARDEDDRLLVPRDELDRDEPELLVRVPDAALASCFCARSNSRWRALASLLLSRRALVTNDRRSL